MWVLPDFFCQDFRAPSWKLAELIESSFYDALADVKLDLSQLGSQALSKYSSELLVLFASMLVSCCLLFSIPSKLLNMK